MPHVDVADYPGLQVVLRKAMDQAKVGLPPDVVLGLMFAVTVGEQGGVAWVAGMERSSAIEMMFEWLGSQPPEIVMEALEAARKRMTP